MKCFTDTSELLRFAKIFLKERVDSLQKDVLHCLQIPYAPFPALLYCFATVDLFGALLEGNAKRIRPSTDHSKIYMEKFMHYSDEQRTLLVDVFRHKLVHLAQPNPVVSHNGKHVSWAYKHGNLSHHLKLVSLNPPENCVVASGVTVSISHRFEISIAHFVEDIRDSVFDPGGYMDLLKQDSGLQQKFDTAILEIYDPRQ